ncbi:MAG: hypothetical protein ACO1RT_20595 [Planctomycetaceae bacterium]
MSRNAVVHRIAALVLLLACSGCSTLIKSASDTSLVQAASLQGSESAEVYKRIQQAKSQNSIVLQVTGDSQPIRVLPLPSDGTPVFVSDLLRQTGIQEKMGRMLVSVHRSSPVDYAGAKMEVRFDEEGESIRPETDYALQSGDRIKIAKDPRTSFGNLMDRIIPSNASRAIVGR